MALCEDELIAKLRSGEKIEDVRVWFMKKIMDVNADYTDLSHLELAFFDSMMLDYEAWKRRRGSVSAS
jgi:hypothetical protein